LRRQQHAAPGAAHAPDLEHVAEVRGIFEHQRQHHLVEPEVGAAHPLVQPLALQRAAPLDVNGAAGRAAPVHRWDGAVGAVDGEDGVVPRDRAGKPRRMSLAHQENQPR
jgi:hypothetical protein